MSYRRIPFTILPYEQKDIAVPKELLMDYSTGNMYIKINDTEYLNIGRETVIILIQEELQKLLGSVKEDGNTFRKLRELIAQLELWKGTLEDASTENILNIIYDKLKDLPDDGSTLLELIESKVEKVDGKILVTNDFTDELFNKLNNIAYGANKYEHPILKQCNYQAPVISVNNKNDLNIIITKEDLGLENVEENANRYIHPSQRQCNVAGVTSVSGETGNVILNKNHVGLSKLENYDIATSEDVQNKVNNKFLTPFTFKKCLEKYLIDNPDPTPDEKYNLSFNLNVTGATIVLDGVTISGTSKQVLKGFYMYTISKPGYTTISDRVIVNGDTTVDIIMTKLYKLTFNILPSGYILEVNNEVWQNNYKLVGNGTYNYKITKSGYITREGSATVSNADKTVSINLKPELSSISASIDSNYASKLYTNNVINKDYITTVAKYTDTSTRQLSATDFNISPDRFSTSGNKTITISYTENNITKSTTLQVYIQEEIKVLFKVNYNIASDSNAVNNRWYYLDSHTSNIMAITNALDYIKIYKQNYKFEGTAYNFTDDNVYIDCSSSTGERYAEIMFCTSDNRVQTITGGINVVWDNDSAQKWNVSNFRDDYIKFWDPEYGIDDIYLNISVILKNGKTYTKSIRLRTDTN